MLPYKPRIIKTKDWNSIEEYYASFQNYAPFTELIKHIRTSGLSNRLFAFTSVQTLIIGIYDPLEWDRETLHIELDPYNRFWKFKYYSQPFSKAEYVQKYPLKQGIEKLNTFIKIIKW